MLEFELFFSQLLLFINWRVSINKVTMRFYGNLASFIVSTKSRNIWTWPSGDIHTWMQTSATSALAMVLVWVLRSSSSLPTSSSRIPPSLSCKPPALNKFQLKKSISRTHRWQEKKKGGKGPAVTESDIRLHQISSSFNILVEKEIYLAYIWSKVENRITLSKILSFVFSFHTKSKICANHLNQFGWNKKKKCPTKASSFKSYIIYLGLPLLGLLLIHPQLKLCSAASQFYSSVLVIVRKTQFDWHWQVFRVESLLSHSSKFSMISLFLVSPSTEATNRF